MIRTTTLPPANASHLAREAVINQMADKIRELGQNGGVTADDLYAGSDFTRAQIAEFAAEAADRASQPGGVYGGPN